LRARRDPVDLQLPASTAFEVASPPASHNPRGGDPLHRASSPTRCPTHPARGLAARFDTDYWTSADQVPSRFSCARWSGYSRSPRRPDRRFGFVVLLDQSSLAQHRLDRRLAATDARYALDGSSELPDIDDWRKPLL